MSHRSIIVLPDDTANEIVAAIDGAKESLLIKMFLFSDPVLIDAVITAKKRGVRVKVMLNPARKSGEEENEETRRKLKEAGI
jgi:phosphatidylserine/phosphatidylglycerophosphate/cardiolipin synthase-like enzyme